MSVKKNDIVSYLVTGLGAITAGATYHRTITTAKDFSFVPLQDAELPSAVVQETEDQSLEQGTASPYDRENHFLFLTIHLRGNGLTMTQVREHIADIRKFVGSDRTMGGYAIGTDPVSDSIVYDQEEQKILGATINIRVLYQSGIFQES